MHALDILQVAFGTCSVATAPDTYGVMWTPNSHLAWDKAWPPKGLVPSKQCADGFEYTVSEDGGHSGSRNAKFYLAKLCQTRPPRAPCGFFGGTWSAPCGLWWSVKCTVGWEPID